MGDFMIINIKQKNIDNGIPGSKTNCPLALALGIGGFKDVNVGDKCIRVKNDIYGYPTD